MRLLITSLLIVLLLAARAHALTFESGLLDAGEDQVRAVRLLDLTGDGVPEILAFTEGPRGPAVHIFPTDAPVSEPVRALDVLRPDDLGFRETWFFCPAKLRADGPGEIVLVDRRKGVSAVGLTGEPPKLGEPRALGDAPELPFYPDPRRIGLLEAAADLDGDGDEELVLPSRDGYRVVNADGTRELAARAVHWMGAPAHRFLTLSWAIPRLLPADWDGDGRIDLVGGRADEFLLFLQGSDGEFVQTVRPLSILGTDPLSGVRNTTLLGDVNGDGRTDLLLVQSPSSVRLFERFTSQHSLFLNPRIFSPESPSELAPPAVSIKTGGISVNPELIDFDGDGDLDLLVTTLDIDMQARIMKKVDAEYSLFLFDGETQAFEKHPYFKVARPFPVAQLEADSTAPVCFFRGDFDGDGKLDLLDIADRGRITILKGTTDTGFLSSDRYGFTAALATANLDLGNDVTIADLNGDGVSDLIGYRGGFVYLIRSSR